MITDLRYAELALAAYETATIATADIQALIVEEAGETVIALRGTHDVEALVRDLLAAVVRHDPILGPVSESFVADAEQLAWRLDAKLLGRWSVTGHSKAAPEAQALARIMAAMGNPPARVVVFAPPQVGPLAPFPFPGTAYAMQHDPIPDLPPNRGRPQALTMLDWIGPVPLDRLQCHAMAAYRAALLSASG